MAYDRYRGITEETLTNGTKNIYVRFKYKGKIYSKKNFTKLYKITEKEKALNKLGVIKENIDKGVEDPFNARGDKLDDYFNSAMETNIRKKKWRPTTVKQYKNFYEGYIQKSIGFLKMDKIEYGHIKSIDKKLEHTKGSFRNLFIRILKPLFDEAIANGEIFINPVTTFKYESVDKKEKLEHRVIEDNLTIVRILYKAFKEHRARYTKHRDEINVYFLLLLFSGHRQNEIINLRREHIYIEHMKIISPSEINKTKVDYHYPLPDEEYILEWVKNKKKGELLFPNLKLDSIYFQFQNIIENTELTIINNKKISPHDIRSMLLNIMIEHCGIPVTTADGCLEHSQRGSLDHYIQTSYKKKVEAFNKYWDCIRGTETRESKKEIQKDIFKETSKEKPKDITYTIEQLEKLIKMKENNYITEKEFNAQKKLLLGSE